MEATETEKIEELIEFVSGLEISTILDATNVSILSPVYGNLPEDKPKILAKLRKILEIQGEDVLRYRRTHLRSL